MLRHLHWLSLMFALGLLGLPLTTEGQPSSHMYRIGLLHPLSPPPPAASDARAEVWRQGLHDLGYVEGQNLVMERR
jgi:hypothetical protein